MIGIQREVREYSVKTVSSGASSSIERICQRMGG